MEGQGESQWQPPCDYCMFDTMVSHDYDEWFLAIGKPFILNPEKIAIFYRPRQRNRPRSQRTRGASNPSIEPYAQFAAIMSGASSYPPPYVSFIQFPPGISPFGTGSEDFATRYLKNNEEIIPNGRTLTVDYERIKTTNEHGRATFCRRAAFRGRSWRPFVICNELKVGDVCIFELIKENGNLLEVFIHRKSQVSLIEIS
ncbi:hypothetical protein V6N13_042874 [Hibiscus sabdariffa]